MITNDKQKAPPVPKHPGEVAAGKQKTPVPSKRQDAAAAQKQKASGVPKRRDAAVSGKQKGTAVPKRRDAGAVEKQKASVAPKTQAATEAEKRLYPRKPLHLSVKMTAGQIDGTRLARDISLGGIFLETEEKMAPGQEVQLSIPFTNQNRRIKLNGKVVRLTEDGVGVQFDIHSIDIE